MRIAFKRAPAAGDMLWYDYSVMDTCWDWRPTSSPKHAIMTAATLIPPAAVCTAWETRSTPVATKVAYQGTSLSMRRPAKGPTNTPSMPTRPKRPIMRLKMVLSSGGKSQDMCVRGIVIGWTSEKEVAPLLHTWPSKIGFESRSYHGFWMDSREASDYTPGCEIAYDASQDTSDQDPQHETREYHRQCRRSAFRWSKICS